MSDKEIYVKNVLIKFVCTLRWISWAPVLIGIGCIAVISLCCFGCFKLCTNNNNRTGVVVTNPNQQGNGANILNKLLGHKLKGEYNVEWNFYQKKIRS